MTKVKPLEWVHHDKHNKHIWRADTVFSTIIYYIREYDGRECPFYIYDYNSSFSDSTQSTGFKTLKEAKSFIQEYYESRILGAIEAES